MYPVLVLDCIFVKVRENSTVINKAVYVAIGINSEGYKDVLGLWLEKTEGAKFWLSVLRIAERITSRFQPDAGTAT